MYFRLCQIKYDLSEIWKKDERELWENSLKIWARKLKIYCFSPNCAVERKMIALTLSQTFTYNLQRVLRHYRYRRYWVRYTNVECLIYVFWRKRKRWRNPRHIIIYLKFVKLLQRGAFYVCIVLSGSAWRNQISHILIYLTKSLVDVSSWLKFANLLWYLLRWVQRLQKDVNCCGKNLTHKILYFPLCQYCQSGSLSTSSHGQKT